MKIDDSYIIKLFYLNNGKGPLNSQLRRHFSNKTRTKIIVSEKIDKEIEDYLNTRYSDSKSLRETLFRIKYNIEIRPHCTTPGCTNEVVFNGTKKKPYMLHCCCKCTQSDKTVRDKYKKTCTELYGCENGAQSDIAKNKIKNTVEKKYGKGITNVWQAKEIQEKSKKTLLKKFGVDNIGKSQYCKDKHKLCEKQTVAKRNETKKKNHTFNTSKTEEQCYEMLINKFGNDDVKRQYSSDQYPFLCDFYIISIDLYIEFNGSWTHGKHAFDPKNVNDIELVNKWKSKNSKFYNNAIHTWTIRDVNKRNVANQNKLFFREFWSLDDVNKFLQEI